MCATASDLTQSESIKVDGRKFSPLEGYGFVVHKRCDDGSGIPWVPRNSRLVRIRIDAVADTLVPAAAFRHALRRLRRLVVEDVQKQEQRHGLRISLAATQTRAKTWQQLL